MKSDERPLLELLRKSYHRSHLINPGFTIVELLVVIVIIGILAAITIVSYIGIQQKATIASLTSDLDNASKLLKLDQIVNSAYPTTLAAANGGKGVPASSGTAYQYVVSNNNPQLFCITATKNSSVYNISQDSAPMAGPCPLLNLNVGNPVSYPGTGTTWTDLSGLGNDGTLMNGVGYSVANGGALSFDKVDDYIALPSGLQSQAYTAITVSAWVKVPSGAQQSSDWGSYIVHNGVDFSVGTSIYALAINTGGTAVWSWAGNFGSMTTEAAYNNGSWHYLVGTWDGSNSTLYVDGSMVKTAAITTNRTGMAGALSIGGTSFNPVGRPFNGLIADVRIHNKALSADDITQNFNALRGRYGI